MKNNKSINTLKLTCLLFILMGNITMAFGQEVRIPFSKGKVIINGAGNLNVEGYDGNEVIVYEMLYELNRPDLMEGLKPLNDNRPDYIKELDIEHKIVGSVLTIQAHGRSGRYNIKVPKDVNISVKTRSENYYYYDGLKNLNFENLTGEIEVSGDGGIDVNIKKSTGSMSVVTYGNISVDFDELPSEGALSFDTYRGFVNLTIPEDAAADLSLTAKKGRIFSNLPLKIKKNGKKELKATLGKNGIDLFVNTVTGGDIYLRKKVIEKN